LNFDLVCARDLMTKKVVMAEPHESLRAAVTRMSEHRIHGLLIRPESPSRGLSILTGKDCIRVICDAGVSALDDLCVEDAMTRPAVTVPAELCIADCLRLMRLAGVRTAPVLDRGELVGILTFTDVLNSLRTTTGG
jgi:CBS domain-containing protein